MTRKGATLALLVTCAFVAAAGPAHAAPVIVVDGQHAVKRNDPLVPPPSDFDLPPAGARASGSRFGRSAVVRASASSRRTRAVLRALRRAHLRSSNYRRYLRDYRKSRSVRRRLKGTRGRQLGYVIGTVESLALRRRLTKSRIPAIFLELERNTQYWPHLPFPASRNDVTFRGSEILFRYFAGEGLQIHPLGTFIKANNMHGACVGVVNAPCRREGLRRLLDEMSAIAVRRSPRFIAWEYLFTFGGGVPPWMSGMAQATGIQAYARAAQLLGQPGYLTIAQKALGAFETAPPVGVRTRGFRGGVHYLQYSYAPRTYIFNAFTQSLIGLYDYAKISGDQRATKLFNDAEPELEREIPASDLGDWSMYSYRGEISDASYHELLREVLQSMCSRRIGDVYCTYAHRYRDYQTDPPEIEISGGETATADQDSRLVFDISKLSAVEITITKGGDVAFHKIATFYRGKRSFLWKPKSAGTYTVKLSAKELRTGQGLKGRTSGTIEVE
jgi:hypothetical protein